MLIDIIFIIIMIVAFIKGYRKGLVIAVFSFLAFIIGLAAALKLSAFVANHLHKDVNISSKWLPVISFIVVFIVVAFLVSWGARLIDKAFKMVLLGWVNRIGGIIFYLLIYTIIFSVVLFYAEKIHLFSQATIDSSKTYSYIKPCGPKAINAFGKIIPVFKNLFGQLEDFFAALPQKIS